MLASYHLTLSTKIIRSDLLVNVMEEYLSVTFWYLFISAVAEDLHIQSLNVTGMREIMKALQDGRDS